MVDARTTSDGGTDGQAYVQGSWKATPTARTGCRASEAWPRRSPFPAGAYVFGTQASEAASHSSQFERSFLSRTATGRPWPLAKNAQFRRGARRPSDAVAGANPALPSAARSFVRTESSKSSMNLVVANESCPQRQGAGILALHGRPRGHPGAGRDPAQGERRAGRRGRVGLGGRRRGRLGRLGRRRRRRRLRPRPGERRRRRLR